MKDVQRQTRTYLMALFQQHGFNPRTDLGQNFLIDVNLIEFVVRHAELGPNDVVLEVGSGTGGMTAFLASAAARVISVEIDRNMFMLAGEAVRDFTNVRLVNRDILKNKNKLDPEIVQLIKSELEAVPDSRLKLVANLPYSVATPVISNLIASDLPWKRMVATIQWELGEKMAAEPGDSSYGALSVWLQAQSSVRILRKLGPKVFWPRPKVDSAIVSIWRDNKLAARIENRAFFLDFLRRLFHHRRKLIRSVLVGMYSKQIAKQEVDRILEELGYPADQRAERMDVESLIRLSNRMSLAVAAADSSGVTGTGSEDEDEDIAAEDDDHEEDTDGAHQDDAHQDSGPEYGIADEMT